MAEQQKEVAVSGKKRKISTKASNIIISVSVVGIMILGLLIWLIIELVPFYGKKNDGYWLSTATLTADTDYVVSLEKTPEKDFVVLNLSDLQYNDAMDLGGGTKLTDETARRAVEAAKPDLITVTGDMVWASPFTRHSIMHFIKLMDSFGIPWAPVFGNHDENGNNDLAWFADRMMESEYCVFKRGPNNVGGLGNYIVNVTENGKIVHSLFMVDSGNERFYPEMDGTGYDFIGVEKQAWYAWAVDGLTAMNGGVTPRSSLFLHIALPEYKDAFAQYCAYDREKNTFDLATLDEEKLAAEGGFGENREGVCSPPVNSGFFKVLKEKNSTFDVVAGHDHVNNSSVLYEGIRLTYGMKTGDRCYWNDDMNGGTKLTINGAGVMTTEHVFVNP